MSECKPHTFCWVDIPVLNLDRAIKFYSAILGQPVTKVEEHGFTFGLLPHDQENVSGCLVVMENRKPSQDGPLIYLNTDGKLDQSISLVESSGGKLIKGKEQIGPYGFRSLIIDTEGNAISLYSRT